MRHSSLLLAILARFAVAACHGGGGSDAQQLGTLVDANATADAVSESARPGTPVGITITAPDLASRGGVTFTLANDANGAFKIDSVTGVISLAASVDYERTPRLGITAHAQSADNHYFAEQAFAIEVIDSPAPSIQIDFPFAHAPYAYATAAVSGRITHPEPSNISVRASAGGATIDGFVDADGHFYVRGVPVAEGDPMTLTVTASHAGNESATSSVVLSRAPDLSVVGGMIVDPTRDRYLLADGGSGTIVAIARNDYARSIVSGAGRGTGPLFDGPYRLALDTDRDLLYVTDAGRAVLSVDPRSGYRALVSAGGVVTPGRGTGEQLLDPKGIGTTLPDTGYWLRTANSSRSILLRAIARRSRTTTRSSARRCITGTVSPWTHHETG